jgi:predicted DNA-binding transcriptional regulator YafY
MSKKRLNRGEVIDLIAEAPHLSAKRTNRTIIECIRENFLLSISYRKIETNRIIKRIVEPYELKREGDNIYLYAYDRTGRTRNTKSFLLDNILSAYKQDREFRNRVF